jgi:hypothetical protein
MNQPLTNNCMNKHFIDGPMLLITDIAKLLTFFIHQFHKSSTWLSMLLPHENMLHKHHPQT